MIHILSGPDFLDKLYVSIEISFTLHQYSERCTQYTKYPVMLLDIPETMIDQII